MQLIRAINAHPKFRAAGLYAHILETKRTQARQNELIREGKSWIKYSPHQNGSAFDLVLCYKGFKPLRITKFFWNNSPFYDLIAEMATDIGLYSYGLVYKKDAFHFELPLIVQPESDCYAYAVINALRMRKRRWREMTKEDAAACAEALQAAAKSHTLKATLTAARDKGWITGFSKLDNTLDVDNDGCFVCQTRRRPLGKNPWGKNGSITKSMEAGKGIPGHGTAIAGWHNGGLRIMNSHRNLAEYLITDFSDIMKIYKIIL